MKPLALGDMTIQSVLENIAPAEAPGDMFPTAAPEDIARHMDWMAPTFYDPASEKLILAFQSFVVRTPRLNILIDTCVGEDKVRPWPHFHMKKWPWMGNLQALGLTPEDIDVVMCTHLHPDHVGWNTQLRDGRWVPTFPNANYVFARDEYHYWEQENAQGSERIGLTFEDSVLPVMEAGLATLVDSDHEIDTGVSIEPTPGHSPGHVVVNLASNGDSAVFTGDLMHHPVQVPEPQWSTCFCWDMEMSANTRTNFVDRYTDTDTIILPVHFAGETAGRIVGGADKSMFEFLDNSNSG